MVKLLLQEFKKAKESRARRTSILSWVAATTTKRAWIKKLFGVSYDVITTARRHANIWSPGGAKVRLSLKKKSYRVSPRYAYLKKWLNLNVESDPAGKKERRLRLLRRHSGYKMYLIDHARDVPHLKPYSRSRFYNHPLQKGNTDTKCCAGLCTCCNRYGVMVFMDLLELAIEITMLLKDVLSFDIDAWKKSHKEVKKYFERGGMFQRKLKMSCNNVHHCISFALSHPTKGTYQHRCQHQHTETDPVCLQRDRLWNDLYDVIENALQSEDRRVVELLSSTGIVGEEDTTTYRKKLVNIRSNLRLQRERHDKYVGHLMLDNAQQKKKFGLRKKVTMLTYTRSYTFTCINMNIIYTIPCNHTNATIPKYLHHKTSADFIFLSLVLW